MKPVNEGLGEYIEIGSRFLRSVSLEQDSADSTACDEYVLTANARQALSRLAGGLATDSLSRAWTVTGPYGVGKSALAVFITRLLCRPDAARLPAIDVLRQADPELAQCLEDAGNGREGRAGMLPVVLTARRAPAALCLLQGLSSGIASLTGREAARIRKKLEAMATASISGQMVDSREVVALVRETAALAIARGHSGVLILIDELGKLFEYAARDPRRGDVFVLQELAEYACRSGSTPVLVLGFLHQSFEDYGQHLDAVTRREWEKIGGRFGDIPFLEPPDQVIRMIAEAIRPTARPLPAALSRQVRSLAREAAQSLCPPAMKPDDFLEAAISSYPLHPVTLVALPHLFRRFAQNERSLFAYLSSQEPFGLQEFLATNRLGGGALPWVRLTDLFDYFTANFGAGLYRHPQAKRWLEAADILEKRDDLSVLHDAVIKSTGILNALGEFSHLRANEEVLSLAVVDRRKPTEELRQTLAQLRERSVLTYRAFNSTFRVWEGSDVDIDERIAEGETRTRGNLGLAEAIQHYMPPRPLIARRHSFETGALRFLTVAYLDDPATLTAEWKATADADVHVAVCLASSGTQLEEFSSAAQVASNRRNDLLIAIPQEIGELRGAVKELAALRWAWDNTPGLRDDRVARREISVRIGEAEQVLSRNLEGLLDPRPEPRGSECLWFWLGRSREVGRPAAVSRLLSDACDQLFSQAPRIRNELISRRSLSAAAAGARRNLVERMLTQADQPLLGIDGYPPERSMYESVLAATGLHRENEQGHWALQDPLDDDANRIAPCWALLCQEILGGRLEPVPLDRLFALLSAPPYGVSEGLHPVLLCAFMMAHADETTLYREGTFLPEIGVADFEVLMRRPELYAVAGGRVAGARADVVVRLAKGLQVSPATVPVVKALFRMVRSLPEFAWKTRALSEPVLAVREAFSAALSPEQLLFADLPKALGLPVFSATDADREEVETFFARLNAGLREWSAASPKTIVWARDELLRACGLSEGEAGWHELRRLGEQLRPWVREPQLAALLGRLSEAASDGEGVESVIALVSQRPPQSWTDRERDCFPEAASIVGTLLKSAAATMRSTESASSREEHLLPSERASAEALSQDIMRLLDRRHRMSTPRTVRAALRLIAEQIGDSQQDE